MNSDYKTVSQSVRSVDRVALWRRVQHASLHLTVNVSDHVRALALLLSKPSEAVPVYAHTTMARTAIESAAYVAYLLDCTRPFEVRFARGVAYLITDSDHARRAAEKVPGNPYMQAPGPAAKQADDDLLAQVVRSKIEIIPNVKGQPKGIRVAPGADEAPMNVKASDLVHAQYPDMPAVYSLMSGVTHGMPHILSGNAWIADRHAHWDADPLDIGGSVLAAINAAETVIAAQAWNYGADHDPAIELARTRIADVNAAIKRFAQGHVPLPRPVAFQATSA